MDRFESQDEMGCPACQAAQMVPECYLGNLGRLAHFRCRACGWQWSIEGMPADEEHDTWRPALAVIVD